MATKEDKPSVKTSKEQLLAELEQQQRHLFDLKSQMVTEKVEDPSQLHKTRKQIARLKTALRAQEIAAAKAEA